MAACTPQTTGPDSAPAAPPAAAAARPAGTGPLAGRTLRCDTGGPVSPVTFGPDGRLSGRLMQSRISGTWRMTGAGRVLIHATAGAVSLRDELARSGAVWKGRTTTCRG